MRRFDVYDDRRFDVYDDDQIWYSDQPDDSYGKRPSTRTEHNILGIYEAEHGDLVTALDLKVGDTAFLLYAVWSTGDSFGHDDGKYLTTIHLFDSREKAELARKAILDHNRANDINGNNPVSYTVVYLDNDGKPQTECASWVGYFESLDDVEIEEVIVGTRDGFEKEAREASSARRYARDYDYRY
ncbi:MAG: hypothetical protein HC836_10645 [Richelia sp. RM2_1_2]|nr:hypothetical protein [Richelia sp. RM2_1_2]